ncbi:MAG: hypothetical protein COA37_17875 [Hoeflea sp.]|uniref:tail protein X n=1 Tax=Hoeflea sp. TaxID=1940281 RepID=UPI000C11DC1D|nr:tail protein X [Hoeflea sp.]PHR19299.1 MAG: hypothetical protein COA37_17875 [Hoeflea sp.]
MAQSSNGYFEHRTMDGDRWDLLAHTYYGDARKQTVLLEANRHLFLDPLVIPPLVLPSGLVLTIPVIDDTEIDDSALPPWKRANPVYGTNP